VIVYTLAWFPESTWNLFPTLTMVGREAVGTVTVL
jgi:hypothetical protein